MFLSFSYFFGLFVSLSLRHHCHLPVHSAAWTSLPMLLLLLAAPALCLAFPEEEEEEELAAGEELAAVAAAHA